MLKIDTIIAFIILCHHNNYMNCESEYKSQKNDSAIEPESIPSVIIDGKTYGRMAVPRPGFGSNKSKADLSAYKNSLKKATKAPPIMGSGNKFKLQTISMPKFEDISIPPLNGRHNLDFEGILFHMKDQDSYGNYRIYH